MKGTAFSKDGASRTHQQRTPGVGFLVSYRLLIAAAPETTAAAAAKTTTTAAQESMVVFCNFLWPSPPD